MAQAPRFARRAAGDLTGRTSAIAQVLDCLRPRSAQLARRYHSPAKRSHAINMEPQPIDIGHEIRHGALRFFRSDIRQRAGRHSRRHPRTGVAHALGYRSAHPSELQHDLS